MWGDILESEKVGELQRYYVETSVEKDLIQLSENHPDVMLIWSLDEVNGKKKFVVFVETENITNTIIHNKIRVLSSIKNFKSRFVGDIGERITFRVDKIEYIGRFEMADLGFYRYYKFHDTEGNIYTWKMWNKGMLPEDISTITGTITKQYTSGKEKINQLQRCKAA